MKLAKYAISLTITFFAILWFAPTAWAFCGFYVAKADTKLYNRTSQVVIVRSSDRTVLTMANDYHGAVKDFAIVVPVPTVLQKDQVHVSEPKIIQRLDAFSAPRLVEYFDSDPCTPQIYDSSMPRTMTAPSARSLEASTRNSSLGVTVEARFNVGEYDIVILSARESGGLETWLNRNGYKIPRGAKQLQRKAEVRRQKAEGLKY